MRQHLYSTTCMHNVTYGMPVKKPRQHDAGKLVSIVSMLPRWQEQAISTRSTRSTRSTCTVRDLRREQLCLPCCFRSTLPRSLALFLAMRMMRRRSGKPGESRCMISFSYLILRTLGARAEKEPWLGARMLEIPFTISNVAGEWPTNIGARNLGRRGYSSRQLMSIGYELAELNTPAGWGLDRSCCRRHQPLNGHARNLLNGTYSQY